MGERKLRRARFFQAHPTCCFCGGETVATTEDHQPARVLFAGRQWPEGFNFPACGQCNEATKETERLMSLLIHGEAENEDRTIYQKTLESIRRDYPDLVGTMLPKSANEVRSILRKKGIEKPVGTKLREVPIVKLDRGFWDRHFDNFARKLMLAFHYQCFNTPLSHAGRIWSFQFSNADFLAGTFPQQMLDMTPNVVQPTRQKRFLDDQFSIRWDVVSGSNTAAFLCHFHSMLAIGGITTETPQSFDHSVQHSAMTPFRWDNHSGIDRSG